jgi:hypothetical protein
MNIIPLEVEPALIAQAEEESLELQCHLNMAYN